VVQPSPAAKHPELLAHSVSPLHRGEERIGTATARKLVGHDIDSPRGE